MPAKRSGQIPKNFRPTHYPVAMVVTMLPIRMGSENWRPIAEPGSHCPMISNAEVDQFLASIETHPLTDGELRQVKEAVYVSLSQSAQEGLDYAFCLSSGGRMYFFFREGEA